MRIGLLGGSFDPIHKAHVAVACAALDQQQLDAVDLIPAGQPWQKPTLKATPEQRAEMIELAIAGKPNLRLNQIELERSGATYTIDTLEMLDNAHTYYWILGSDQLANFCSWHRWEDIAQRVTLLVAERPGSPQTIPDALQQRVAQGLAKIQSLPLEPMPISASDLRQKLAQGACVDDMLDPRVAQYIKQHKLYEIQS
ncbi:nicotinate-nucleotide adenylyltransferase [Orrella sp. 11846]|uniref:nicotinate-nucleotide adenylyltransferase n=1 Tax=Orrella sp. 11846 TaxID=3409913 RepID=UPI003B5B93F5